MDIEFFYTLKKIDTSGFIHKTNIVYELTKRCSLNTSSIYRRINRLVRLGLVKKTANGYRVCSYKYLFHRLGYVESKYYNIVVSDTESVLDISAKIEIKKKLREQSIAARLALNGDKRYQRSFKKTRGNLLERLDQVVTDNLAYMVEVNQLSHSAAKYSQLSQSSKKINYCNPDITLSYDSIKELLNLSSTSQAFDLMNRLESKEYLSIQRDRQVLIESNISYYQFLSNYNDRYFRYRGRNVYKILPNKYFFK